MKLTFYGAANEVTGSKFLIETSGKQILVDCGMHQGSKAKKELNYSDFPFNPAKVDYLLLTHAHIDHSGLIPKFIHDGFTGKILTTSATAALCGIMLKDSAHIQETENRWDNQKRKRKGLPPRLPLYTIEDAEKAAEYFQTVEYNNKIDLGDGVAATFFDAGHILGSAHILFESEELRIGFSGDIGSHINPVLKQPRSFEDIDYLVMESTYGNRGRHKIEDSLNTLSDIINESLLSGGKILIPSFAIGRTQLMFYYLNQLLQQGKINIIKIFLDSPLAIKATNIYHTIVKEMPNYFSDKISYLKKEIDPFSFPSLETTLSVADSQSINNFDQPAIIISAAGMCNAGRILHHLKHNLWNPNTSVVFVGYQAEGTLGRGIKDGKKNVSIFGESIEVNASIYSLDSFSAHADSEHLVGFVDKITNKPKSIFIVHGEIEAQKALQKALFEKLNIKSIIPSYTNSFELTKEGVKSIYTDLREAFLVEEKNIVFAESIDIDKKIGDLIELFKKFYAADKPSYPTNKNFDRLGFKSEKGLLLLKKLADSLGAVIFDSFQELMETEGLTDTKLEQKLQEFRKEYYLSIDPSLDDFIKKVSEVLKPTNVKN
jgi:metallo-beta-lactamase family protein